MIEINCVTLKHIGNGIWRMFLTRSPWSYVDMSRVNAAGMLRELRKVKSAESSKRKTGAAR